MRLLTYIFLTKKSLKFSEKSIKFLKNLKSNFFYKLGEISISIEYQENCLKNYNIRIEHHIIYLKFINFLIEYQMCFFYK